MVNVIVLFPKQEVARSIRNLLVRSGFEVTAVCATGAQVVQRTREEVRLLEEVKELLMQNNQITESEAHAYIQQRSMNSGVGLIEMAKMIKESLTYQN